MSTAYLKLSSTVGNTAMTVPLSWSSAALSTFSPTANFDIENSFRNYRNAESASGQIEVLSFTQAGRRQTNSLGSSNVVGRCGRDPRGARAHGERGRGDPADRRRQPRQGRQ